MAPKFNDIISSTQFQSLTPDQKQSTLTTYFEKYVAPSKEMQGLNAEQAKIVTDKYYEKVSNVLGQGQATALRGEYPSEKFASYAEPISQFAGMLRKGPIVGSAVAGLATAGAEAGRQAVQAFSGEPSAPYTLGERATMIGKAGLRGAAGEALGRGVFAGVSKVGEYIKPGMVKTGAQFMKMSAGIPEPTGQAVLSDMGRLGRAPSGKEAGAGYAKAMEATGLSQGPEAAMEAMGKSALTQEGATNFAYDALQKLKTGELTYQDALVARDQLKNILKMPKWQNPSIAQNERFLVKMRKELDDYLEPYFQEAGESFKGARGAYREAKLAEDFSSLFPTNANKTASVLRGTIATGMAGAGAGGYVDPETAAASIALASPRMLGLGIRGAAVAAPVIREAAKFGTRLGTQYVAGKIVPSSTEELMRKHYEAQK